jgi:hypothetical protein
MENNGCCGFSAPVFHRAVGVRIVLAMKGTPFAPFTGIRDRSKRELIRRWITMLLPPNFTVILFCCLEQLEMPVP